MSAAEIVPSESSDDDVVIFEQPATRVFENVHGQIVIRQTGQVFEDDPFFFSIARTCLPSSRRCRHTPAT